MFSKISLIVLGFFAVTAQAQISNGRLIPSPTEKMFIPVGFDDNDNVEIIVHGHFRNSCYKTGPTEVKVDRERRIISVWPQSYEYTNALCAQVIVPFMQTVKVGNLDSGNYKVVVENNGHLPAQTLTVKPRHTDAPDDYLYAPVENAFIEFRNSITEQTLVVQGTYPFTFVGCAIMRDVRVDSTSPDILVVQPVMEMLTDNAECVARNWKQNFTFRVNLETALPLGANLIHVRVLNGNSYNRIEQISVSRLGFQQ